MPGEEENARIMGKHRNHRQDALILEFMRKHPDIARSLTKKDRGAVTAAWQELALQLNPAGPPHKTADEWRSVWKDWKLAIKKKITFNQVALSPTEEEIAHLCHLFEAVVAGEKPFDNLLPVKEENVEDILEETPPPKRPRMDAASCSKTTHIIERAPSENRLALVVEEENMVLREIKDELVELKITSQEMLEERKKTNLILEKLVLAIETKFK
ncbi:hypothetical protein ACLKA7_013440 [Drosophila subpalustris]